MKSDAVTLNDQLVVEPEGGPRTVVHGCDDYVFRVFVVGVVVGQQVDEFINPFAKCRLAADIVSPQVLARLGGQSEPAILIFFVQVGSSEAAF